MHSTRSLLWVGPSTGLRRHDVLDSARIEITWVSDIDQALELDPTAFDGTMLDLDAAKFDLQSVTTLCSQFAARPIMICVANPNPRIASELKKLGAGDVWTTNDTEEPGVLPRAILHRLDSTGLPRARPKPESPPEFPGIVAQSSAMKGVLDLVRCARRSSVTVLLRGETGTGKEVLARAIHGSHDHSAPPFVAVNCAALPEGLLDSELFGHTKGSFTGADRDRAGVFESAHGGTLFLDEIGETPRGLQAKLLRVLQEREIRRIGEQKSRPIEIRLITATNRVLESEIESGRFRNDLYYRLAVFPIEIPPLRERPEDILPLAADFLCHYGEREGKTGCSLSGEAANLLLAHDWPGNVRELQNEIQRALAFAASGNLIPSTSLSSAVRNPSHAKLKAGADGETLKNRVNRYEAWLLRCELDRNGGHRTRTARRLGITREGLHKKMKRFGIS